MGGGRNPGEVGGKGSYSNSLCKTGQEDDKLLPPQGGAGKTFWKIWHEMEWGRARHKPEERKEIQEIICDSEKVWYPPPLPSFLLF